VNFLAITTQASQYWTAATQKDTRPQWNWCRPLLTEAQVLHPSLNVSKADPAHPTEDCATLVMKKTDLTSAIEFVEKPCSSYNIFACKVFQIFLKSSQIYLFKVKLNFLQFNI